jgi:hypothetical protein
MSAKKAVVRRAVGGALVLVRALAVAGPVGAGKKPPSPPPPTGDKTAPTAPTNLRVTTLSHAASRSPGTRRRATKSPTRRAK